MSEKGEKSVQTDQSETIYVILSENKIQAYSKSLKAARKLVVDLFSKFSRDNPYIIYRAEKEVTADGREEKHILTSQHKFFIIPYEAIECVVYIVTLTETL